MKLIPLFIFVLFIQILDAQTIFINKNRIDYIEYNASKILVNEPVCSFELNKQLISENQLPATIQLTTISQDASIEVSIKNNSQDTVRIRNFIPLDIKSDRVYITGLGEHILSRTHLFIPQSNPVNIIVPDNLWHMGYNSIKLDTIHSIYFFSRRKSWDKVIRRRFEMEILPGGSLTHTIYYKLYTGLWQNGIKDCFQKNKLYDLSSFNDSLYQRKDLQWIQRAKMMHLIMAWDEKLYDKNQKRYTLKEFIHTSKSLYGGDDVIGIWPTWPALGLDIRNQWDMYRDMPGGTKALHKLIAEAHALGTKIFIAYNPWDESTRKEDHLSGMATLLQETNADGVILDTRGSSSKELQATADKIKPGVIMYSEGMAIPADMENIISGRVHNALYYPPILNLNKLIKPDFSIFRVAEVYKEPIRREIHTALFNGYGIEFNIFHPGDPMYSDSQYKYLGRALRILRENHVNFMSSDWRPLFPSLHKNVLINYWPGRLKDIYTLYKNSAEEIHDTILTVDHLPNTHYVDLWNHKEIAPIKQGHKDVLKIKLDAYTRDDQNTNNEGSVLVLAAFDSLLTCILHMGESIECHASKGSHIAIWPGKPSYEKKPRILNTTHQYIFLDTLFTEPANELTIQLFDSSELLDERIITWPTDSPIKVLSDKYITSSLPHLQMAVIPADTFRWITSHGDEFIPYPKNGNGEIIKMKRFLIDRHPVTNKAFKEFIIKSKYKPSDKTNFLKHWKNGSYPTGLENHPVTYISKADAAAYCAWNQKRLPTELEWQYAAQTAKRNTWPWGHDAGIKNIKAEIITETLTHEIFESFDSTKANPGNGKPDAINTYPQGANSYGLTDLVGSVWQITADDYKIGSYKYTILKGGSYYKPTSSWWYVQGGPKPLSYRQMWLQVDEGFERNATVGCRCARDIK